jgi:hypothetical protein
VALVTVALLAGCAGSSPGSSLSGGIRFVGRIPPGYTGIGYQRGLVQILRGETVVASAHLPQGQGYRFALDPGTYFIRTWGNARPPLAPCPETAVTIPAGRTVRADVYCDFQGVSLGPVARSE